jgi:hypothetical protein
MIFPTEGELLAHSLERVKAATGLNENKAKVRLCRAMADMRVAVRFAPTWVTFGPTGGYTISASGYTINTNFPVVSPRLRPKDLDWISSRPLKRSAVGTAPFQRGSYTDQEHVTLELSTADVIERLCGGLSQNPHENDPVKTTEEAKAISALAVALQRNPNLRREDASSWCNDHCFKLSTRAFQNRVWPSARLKAGLDPKAPSGRKPKSSR